MIVTPFAAIADINTQARRLKYVSALIHVLGKDLLSYAGLLSRLRRWNDLHVEELNFYPVNTGRVASSDSAQRRYLALASSLSLLSHVITQYRITKLGNVLRILLDKDHFDESNSFFLSINERIFYLYLILLFDQDFVLTVLEELDGSPQARLKELQEGFYQTLTNRLMSKIDLSLEKRGRDQLKVKLDETSTWKKPARYAEHIVPPRLHWLLDLKLIDASCFTERRYSLNKKGASIWSSLPRSSSGLVDVPPIWLQDHYFSKVASFLDVECHLASLDSEEDQALVKALISDAFRLLRTEFVPRVPLAEVSLLVCIWMLSSAKRLLDLSTFNNWLQKPQHHEGFVYQTVMSARVNERYVIRKNAPSNP